ncbi:cysteine--tRNA ligase, partial [Candidatus Bathyarchaeota archaeon]
VYRRLLDALGLFERRRGEVSELAEALIELIVKIRERLRAEKNYKLSDKIREELAEIGVILGDKPEGTSWKFERQH